MANIPLKSIKFPDLADTYTVPSNAGELPYNKSATYPADTVGKALQNIGDSSAPAILETATGSIASFTDGANLPVKDLVAEIVPLQSGSGDPSPDNVRPITGWTEAEIHVADGESPHIVDNVTTISFASAGTVYGGRLDVTSGVLVVDRARTDLGSLGWSFIAPTSPFPYGYFYASLSGKEPGETNIIADIYKTYVNMQGDIDNGISGSASNNRIFVVNSAYSDVNAFKTAMNGKYVVCELATPQTYQLTPTEVKSLLKNNNIWADTGDVTVEYVADTKTFIENLVNA